MFTMTHAARPHATSPTHSGLSQKSHVFIDHSDHAAARGRPVEPRAGVTLHCLMQVAPIRGCIELQHAMRDAVLARSDAVADLSLVFAQKAGRGRSPRPKYLLFTIVVVSVAFGGGGGLSGVERR